jgi:nitrile hydratase accessory protein
MSGTEAARNHPVPDLPGPVAIPQQGRVLLFDATWEANAFALALALHESKVFEWDAFRDRLIVEIADAEAQGRASSYYERWLAALERLLVGQGLMSSAELDTRTALLAAASPDAS